MTLLDNGWTEEQAHGLLQSLNSTGELPSGNGSTSRGYDPGARLAKRI